MIKKGLRVPGFLDVCQAARQEDLQIIRDEEYFDAIEDMRGIHSKSLLKEKEICYGIRFEEHGLLSSEQCRRSMPPSRACNDAMHAYFCSGGIAQLEIMLCWERLASHTAMTTQRLREMAVSHGWKKGPRSQAATLRALFRKSYFEGDHYRGDACQTKNVLPLLAYYAWELLEQKGLAPAECASLYRLLQCAAEVRRLEQRWRPLATRKDVEPLQKAQERRHAAFYAAYGEARMRPKHHHRLHVCDGALKLGRLLTTEIMEKKHQSLKSRGLLSRQRAKLGSSAHLQSWLLPRLLADTIEGSKRAQALALWTSAGSPGPADPDIRHALRDNSVQKVPQMHLWQNTVHVTDVLLIGDERACLVNALYQAQRAPC